jgi:inner membrane protease ATP23
MASTDTNSGKPKMPSNTDDYGYDFYPERLGVKKEGGMWNRLSQGRAAGRTLKCASNVNWCAENNPMVKLLIKALRSHGCTFDMQRHVSCEDCISRVNGGYDPFHNQVVICKNNSTSRDMCCAVLTHELIHMFDFCRAKVDFTNLEHLACTEIRAATMMHCSFMAAMSEGDASFLNYKQRHQECVKKKATMSVMLARNVDEQKARSVVDHVFTRCYADREPFGRIPRHGSRDPERMFAEGSLYGYCD